MDSGVSGDDPCLPPLHSQSRIGNLAEVEKLLEEGHDVNATHRGLLPHHLATWHGHDNVLATLIRAGASIDESNEVGWTSLHMACRQGHLHLLDTILATGCNQDARDKYGRTPLALACHNKEWDVVTVLLSKSNCSMFVTDDGGYSPLHWAAEAGSVPHILIMLEKGAPVDFRDGSGWTPLFWAAGKGHLNAVQCLIGAGASVNACDSSKVTPLHKACAKGHIEVVRVLCSNGARVDAADRRGVTPLMAAASNGDYQITKILLNFETGVEKARPLRQTPPRISPSPSLAATPAVSRQSPSNTVVGEVPCEPEREMCVMETVSVATCSPEKSVGPGNSRKLQEPEIDVNPTVKSKLVIATDDRGMQFTNVHEWLESVDMSSLAPAFDEHMLTLDSLPALTQPLLDRIGIPLGLSLRLLKGIQTLEFSSETSSQRPQSVPPNHQRNHSMENETPARRRADRHSWGAPSDAVADINARHEGLRSTSCPDAPQSRLLTPLHSESPPALGEEVDTWSTPLSPLQLPPALKQQEPETSSQSISVDELQAAGVLSSDGDEDLYRGRYKLSTKRKSADANIIHALDMKTHSRVVIKLTSDPNDCEKEIQMLQKMKDVGGSKFVVSLIDYYSEGGEGGDTGCIILETGECNLAEYLRNEDLNSFQKKDIIYQVASIVQFLHDNGLVHCDLKPQNLVKFGNKWKLIDLETMLSDGENVPEPFRWTRNYGGPEFPRAVMHADKLVADSALDIWSFGVIAYEVLMECPLFSEPPDLIELASPVALDVDIDEDLVPASAQRLIVSCLDKDAASRPTASDLFARSYLTEGTITEVTSQLTEIHSKQNSLHDLTQSIYSQNEVMGREQKEMKDILWSLYRMEEKALEHMQTSDLLLNIDFTRYQGNAKEHVFTLPGSKFNENVPSKEPVFMIWADSLYEMRLTVLQQAMQVMPVTGCKSLEISHVRLCSPKQKEYSPTQTHTNANVVSLDVRMPKRGMTNQVEFLCQIDLRSGAIPELSSVTDKDTVVHFNLDIAFELQPTDLDLSKGRSRISGVFSKTITVHIVPKRKTFPMQLIKQKYEDLHPVVKKALQFTGKGMYGIFVCVKRILL